MASERDNAPIKRQAHQSIESMAAQMTAKKETRSPKSRLYYNEVSSELKAAALDTAIRQQQALLKRTTANGRVDLNNLDEVRKSCEDYIESCRIAGIIPSVTGLAPSMGYSRQALTAYISNNNTSTSQYLDAVRSAMAAITEQAGLTRAASEAVSIFVLKNSAGMADKLDVTATPPEDNGKQEIDLKQIEREYFDGNDSEWEDYQRGERPYSWNDINDPNFIHHKEPRPMWEGYEDDWLKTHDPDE